MTPLLTAILIATIISGTPLVIAALGELVVEKSGVLNLGIEGMMAVGALAGFAVTYHTGQAGLGILAAMLAGMALSLVFAVLALTLMANQVACGLALSIAGLGLAGFLGKPYEALSLPQIHPLPIPILADIPIVGTIFFHHQILVYVSWALFAAVMVFLYKTRAGLLVRAIGESPHSAHAIGSNVIAIRYAATLFGGAMAGLAGAFMSIFFTPLWDERMISGRGWIAAALVVFATWRPARVLIGAYLFGGVMILQLFIQGSGWQISIPSQFLSAMPYLATILVLVVISQNRRTIRLHSPMSLGVSYRPD
ncbi:MAG: ABC transporter permease [Candidatus Symbiobacter sp.]|nr:ABC transporter permease [Candidatus Symbiobacter sp.]